MQFNPLGTILLIHYNHCWMHFRLTKEVHHASFIVIEKQKEVDQNIFRILTMIQNSLMLRRSQVQKYLALFISSRF